MVVSNRTATPGEARAGGLAVALGDALQERGGIWFGWSGRISDSAEPAFRVVADGNIDFALADLTSDEHEKYYLGYANGSLWPVFHYRVDLAEFNETTYRVYANVNRRFGRLLAPLLRPNDIVWVHDYHLLLLGRELRLNGWRGKTGFFLHIPFPAPEIFAALPNHVDLAHALTRFDVVGFQTRQDARNFRRYLAQHHGATRLGDGMMEVDGHVLRTAAFPIGIDCDDMRAMASSDEATAAADRLRRILLGRSLVLGADRMDYSKGLPHRLEAFGRLLEDHADLHGTVSMLQIASPSRLGVGAYSDLRAKLDSLSGRINGDYADLDWTPVRYLARCYPRETLSGLYRLARVGLVTPLRDGMNLVAKEFVAAQDPEDPGVLVLSEFAGAAEQLDAALLVNPHDTAGVAEAIRRGLRMPLDERKRRWRALDDNVQREDLSWWRRKFLRALQTARPLLEAGAKEPSAVRLRESA